MTEHEDELEVVADEVDWHADSDGTEWFVENGVRYELADDGYAYPVIDEDGQPVPIPQTGTATPEDDDAGAADQQPPSPFSREGEAVGGDDLEDTQVIVGLGGAGEEDGDVPGDVSALLRLEGVKSGYGSLPVLHGVDLEIRRGETAVLLGLNGAGKTTTALNICGALETWDGSILFDGEDISGWQTKRCVEAGIIMVPEGRRVFPDLSVEKNLLIGAWSRRKESGWFEEQRERVFDYFPRLRERTDQLAGTLSGGEQQMLSIGRGLMGRPKLLVVDEASMGLAPVIVQDVFDIVDQINRDGTTVLMIEQNLSALENADLGLVMEQGRIVKKLRGERLKDTSEVSDILMG